MLHPGGSGSNCGDLFYVHCCHEPAPLLMLHPFGAAIDTTRYREVSMPPTAMPFPRLQIAQIDGQGQPTLRKQAHLRRMFETLTRSASTITLAIQSDSSHSAKEVKLELSLALFELKSLYESLDLAADLRSSQDVPLNQNNLARMRPTGIVYIVPTKHCLFYSAISPVAAAIAAGNAVILEVSSSLMEC